MKILNTALLTKFLKIIILIIFTFAKTNTFAAVSSFVDNKVVHPNDGGIGQNSPTGVSFNPNGTRMYVTGTSGNRIMQYTLTTPFDISTSTLLEGSICNFSAVANDGLNINFNSDGTKVFLADTSSGVEDIEIFSLTTAYDVSTCVSEGNKDLGITELRDIEFSNDGYKLFIFDKGGNGGNHSILQYSLLSPFDLSNPTLVKEYIGPNGNIKNNIQKFAQGLEFSSDGSKMFITGGGATSTSTKGGVYEFTLASPFDLRGTVTYEGEYSSAAQILQLAGLTFSADGLKMFLVDFTDDEDSPRAVYEYDLTCGFGVIKCIDPTANKDDVASIESQSDATKKIIQHTTYPVINRMEWLRRNSGRVNLTNQNIKFQFNNEMLNALSSSLIPLYFSNDNSNELNYTNSNWSFWSEGSISIGRAGDSATSSFKDIKTSGITFGADKKGEDDIMRGIALRFGADDVDVGDLGSALDMSSFSLTFYQSKPKGEQRFTDHLLGLSFLNSNLINNSGSSSTDGERYGEQIYGSLSLRDTFSKNRLNFTPKIKINYGITHLGAYTETGATGLNLKYNDQYIGNFTSSVGTSLDNTYDLKMGSFIPYYDFEYYADMSPSSQQKFSYVSNGENFILENINNSTHNFMSSIGFDFISESGLTLMTKYTRDQAQNNKNDSYIIALDYRGSQRSSYAMSIQDTSAKLSHNKELNGFKINLDSHYDFFKDDPDYGIDLKISSIY